MKQTIIEEFPEELEANSVPRQVNRTGEFIVITEADWPIEMNVPGMTSGWIRCELGFEYRMVAGEAFGVAYFRNTRTDATCNMRALLGFGSVVDRRLNVVATRPNQFVQFGEAPTISEGFAGPLAAGDSKRFSGVSDNPACAHRKAIIITNPDAALSLSVYCSAVPTEVAGVMVTEDVICALVGPRQSFVIESSDSFLVENANAEPMAAFHVLQTFYRAQA